MRFTLPMLFSVFSFIAIANPLVLPNLPEPVTNNAVAQVTTSQGDYLISFMGLGGNKTYKDVHNRVWALKLGNKQWQSKNPVPASLPLPGRLASVAVGVGPYAYVFGGYTVASDHQEISSPDVYRYDVVKDTYKVLPSMPVPVDDSVALVYQQRYIYLVSGWHNAGNVNLVQVYDIKNNSWQQASPFLGKPVFGQAGAIVGNTLLVCDGVIVQPQLLKRRTYQDIAQCLKGTIDESNPLKIDWQLVEHPTGQGRYRMASAGVNGSILFIGGSTNPYNFNGMGYNGIAAPATSEIWLFDPNTNKWIMQLGSHDKSMDHRGLLIYKSQLIIVGGMDDNQQVVNSVKSISLGNTIP
ncbi:kelch repeat-containing protein [Thalassotalea psychrophila]|uniref:Kelch repeat-containing protein n=1 Tax=Thalassotalea psychrophila TaxID=3065647 RepID=A0ABY9TTB0_9GAMM|nr:kelch repeat-containing protein [Colwelliaceae bacterium SQ149]